MAVKIRLKRFGKIRSPHYRIVVADSRTKRDGRAIEIGKYHPKNDPPSSRSTHRRAQHWLSVGAQQPGLSSPCSSARVTGRSSPGDASPSGVLPQPEKRNKTDAFNAALAEAGKEPKAASATYRKAASKPESAKPEPASVEGSKEAQQAADAGVADADSSET